jgi:hypothetical protein
VKSGRFTEHGRSAEPGCPPWQQISRKDAKDIKLTEEHKAHKDGVFTEDNEGNEGDTVETMFGVTAFL